MLIPNLHQPNNCVTVAAYIFENCLLRIITDMYSFDIINVKSSKRRGYSIFYSLNKEKQERDYTSFYDTESGMKYKKMSY